MNPHLAPFLFLTLLAEIIGTIGGFGSSVFFVPIANFYFSFENVLGLTALFHIASNISKITLFKKGVNKYLLLWLGLPSVLLVIIGGKLSASVEATYLEFGLAAFLILFSLFFLLFPNISLPKSRIAAIIGGGTSGFLAGFVGTGGAVRGLTMAAFQLEKSTFIATSAGIDLMVDLSRGGVYFLNGYFTREIMVLVPFLLIIGWGGTWIGKKILHRINQDTFRKISLVLILLIGTVMMLPLALDI
ncbi:MAG: hypothetical protein RL226_1873 [Bacteroidota bacterium]|jgi:uncharacterized membrane protein YfcA